MLVVGLARESPRKKVPSTYAVCMTCVTNGTCLRPTSCQTSPLKGIYVHFYTFLKVRYFHVAFQFLRAADVNSTTVSQW